MKHATKIKGIHHTGLSVSDLNASLTYYEKQLGFTCVLRHKLDDSQDLRSAISVDNAKAEIALLRGETGYLELMQFEQRPAERARPEVFEGGIRHACIQAIEVEPLFDACVAAGGSAHARPSGLGTGALYAYIRDPEDNILELEGVPWGPSQMAKPWYAHTATVTPDINRLTAFYETLIGVSVHDRGSFGPHKAFDRVAGIEGVEFDGAWIKLPNATLEFWQYAAPKTEVVTDFDFRQIGWNHICFEVEDLNAMHASLMDEGVELCSPILRDEYASSFYGRDPDGNFFEFIEFSQIGAKYSLDKMTGWTFLSDLEEAVQAHYRRA